MSAAFLQAARYCPPNRSFSCYDREITTPGIAKERVFAVAAGELIGQDGDLLRLTSYMSASGVAHPEGSVRQYDADLQMFFMIPEPTTTALIGAGLLLMLRQPRRRAAE